MTPEERRKRLNMLCGQIKDAQDPEVLHHLVKELNALLSDGERQPPEDLPKK